MCDHSNQSFLKTHVYPTTRADPTQFFVPGKNLLKLATTDSNTCVRAFLSAPPQLPPGPGSHIWTPIFTK
jgi:hypothetical protein